MTLLRYMPHLMYTGSVLGRPRESIESADQKKQNKTKQNKTLQAKKKTMYKTKRKTTLSNVQMEALDTQCSIQGPQKNAPT